MTQAIPKPYVGHTLAIRWRYANPTLIFKGYQMASFGVIILGAGPGVYVCASIASIRDTAKMLAIRP